MSLTRSIVLQGQGDEDLLAASIRTVWAGRGEAALL